MKYYGMCLFIDMFKKCFFGVFGLIIKFNGCQFNYDVCVFVIDVFNECGIFKVGL